MFHFTPFFVCTLFLSLASTMLQGVANVKTSHSEEEAFLIRRIDAFWRDEDFETAEMYIVEFLDSHPTSRFKDDLLGRLGDIYLQKQSHQNALNSYSAIEREEMREKTLVNKLLALYALDRHEEIAAAAAPFLNAGIARKEELHFLMGESLLALARKEGSAEKKEALAKEARTYYNSLSSTEGKEMSALALAEIAGLLGEHEQGASDYRSLAEKHPEMKELLLFQAALLQSKFDPSGAEKLFRELEEGGGAHASSATFNRMTLLLDQGKYEETLNVYNSIREEQRERYPNALYLIAARSFFLMGRYEEAIAPLSHFIERSLDPSSEVRNSLLMQMTCARELSNAPLFEKAFDQFTSLFPDDPETSKALFMHAMLLKELQLTEQADEKLKQLKAHYPPLEDQESFLFECGLLAYQNERWEESYEAFKGYIERMETQARRLPLAWKLLLSAATHLYQEREGERRLSLFEDLERALKQETLFTAEESASYALIYAKLGYEMERYSDALLALHDYLFPLSYREEQRELFAEAHFVAALISSKRGGEQSAFCMHLEEAIALNPKLYDLPNTHLELYNAYISLAGFVDGHYPNEGAQQSHFIDQAAHHLESAFAKGAITIHQESRLWLANHYYDKVERFFTGGERRTLALHPEIEETLQLACAHFKGLLFKEEHLMELSNETLHLEREVVKLGRLLSHEGRYQEQLQLIKELLQQQVAKKELNWCVQREALFQLATAYERAGEREKAFETFAFIHSCADRFPLPMATHASLRAAHLHFELLDESAKSERSKEVIAILSDLKELQIRKNVSSEPDHLEAALEYATIRAHLAKAEEKEERYLFFLKRIEEDLTSKEDLLTKDYLEKLDREEEKGRIFKLYLSFIEAEKMRAAAHKLEAQQEREELCEKALARYNEIKEDNATPDPLYARVDSSIHAINQLNTY